MTVRDGYIGVGRPCDEYDHLRYEDPHRDEGISHHGHAKLRELVDTPLLLTEHVRGLEPYTDFVSTESTDFVRADPEYDAGITGALRIARVAEAFGLDVEFHTPGPLQTSCMAAIWTTNYYGMALVNPGAQNTTPPAYRGDYSDTFDAVDAHGKVPVSDGPGLGVEYDRDHIETNATRSVHVYE